MHQVAVTWLVDWEIPRISLWLWLAPIKHLYQQAKHVTPSLSATKRNKTSHTCTCSHLKDICILPGYALSFSVSFCVTCCRSPSLYIPWIPGPCQNSTSVCSKDLWVSSVVPFSRISATNTWCPTSVSWFSLFQWLILVSYSQRGCTFRSQGFCVLIQTRAEWLHCFNSSQNICWNICTF